MTKKWNVQFSKKAKKQALKLPVKEREKLKLLSIDLQKRGPVVPHWPNYSKLGRDEFHCHLSYSWVACWRLENEVLKLIQVYYTGSRENAPY